jgi:hypothetical protein
LAGSYETVFTELDGDGEPSGADITYVVGGTFQQCPTCYLLVKDGDAGNPSQYLFDIGTWNGTDTLTLTNFWPGDVPGAISNVAIWSAPDTVVPIPAAAWLFGSALLGMAGIGYRRRQGSQAA